MNAGDMPPVVGILLQKVTDGSFGARDRLQTYLRREPQGVVTISQAARINAILAQHGELPVEVPESATVGTAESMIAEHLAVDHEWTGSRYAPMSAAMRDARTEAIDDVMRHVAQLGVDARDLNREEQASLRALLAMAARGLT